MIQILEQYFITNGQLDLAQIGSLKWLKKEAIWQGNIIKAPVEEVVFDPIANKPSRSFYNYLADELGISTDQAIIKFEEFINTILNDSTNMIQLGNLGILHKNESGYQWESSFKSNVYLNDIHLPELNDEIIEENYTTRSNNWLVWALFLFVISMALILYKQF